MHKTQPRSRTRTVLMAATAAALLSTTLAAGPASAQSSFVSIVPKVAPRVDVAQGALFPTVARDSSGISFAESWKLVPAGNGEVFIVNRLLKNGAEVALDTQDTAAGGPSDPGNGSTIGTSILDRSSSQKWKEQRVTFGGRYDHSTFTNRFTGRKLTFNGTGFNPAYSQKSGGGVLSDFVVTTLG